MWQSMAVGLLTGRDPALPAPPAVCSVTDECHSLVFRTTKNSVFFFHVAWDGPFTGIFTKEVKLLSRLLNQSSPELSVLIAQLCISST